MTETPEATSRFVTAKTEGLNVRSRDGDRLGHLHAFMIDKRSGATAYGVLSLGGVLGLGKSFYPIPFALLSYDGPDDSYIVTPDRRLLEGGPSWANHAPVFNQAYADRVSSYYEAASAPASALQIDHPVQ